MEFEEKYREDWGRGHSDGGGGGMACAGRHREAGAKKAGGSGRARTRMLWIRRGGASSFQSAQRDVIN